MRLRAKRSEEYQHQYAGSVTLGELIERRELEKKKEDVDGVLVKTSSYIPPDGLERVRKEVEGS